MAEFKKFSTQGLFTQYQLKLRQFDQDFLKIFEEVLSNLGNLLNRGISFDDNFDGRLIGFTSNAVANVEDSVAHNLGRVPTGFIVVALDKGAVLYKGGTADTKTAIHLKSTVASTTFSALIF